jgi:hypothetical protein
MHQAVAGPVLFALLLPCVACAHRGSPDEFGPLQPVIDPYSRNLIVCLPTAFGNAAGGLPGQLLLAPFAFVDLDKHQTTERVAGYLTGALVLGPALVLGGVVGTPFLPFSYLAEEYPCNFI